MDRIETAKDIRTAIGCANEALECLEDGDIWAADNAVCDVKLVLTFLLKEMDGTNV